MKRHWTRNLPEVGTDFIARRAEELDERISALAAQLRAVKAEREEVEEEARHFASQNWTEQEIAEAIKGGILA